MRDNKVTVVCMVYNHEKYLEQCLDSLINQKTNFDYKIIVHDDFSTDNSKEIIDRYYKLHPDIIQTIYQKENQYSLGINIFDKFIKNNLEGKYLAFCEGDDFWCDENKLQLQYDALENNMNCSICVNEVTFCEEDGTITKIKMPNPKYNFTENGIIDRSIIQDIILGRFEHPFQTSSYFIRINSLLDPNNYFINWTNDDLDRDYLLSCSLAGDFYYFCNTMSCRRNNVPTSWTTNLKKQGVEGKIKNVLNLMDTNILFNTYTGYVYNYLIFKGIYKRLTRIMRYNSDVIYRYISDNRLYSSKIFDYLSLKESLHFILVYNFPFFGRFLK